MPRLFALVYAAAIVLTISEIVQESLEESAQKMDTELAAQDRGHALPLFLLHLLKLKTKVQKVQKVPTTPPTADCICVPYYLCNANGTVITDGIGVIDIRYRRCTGDLEVCCRLPNTTTTTTTTMKPTTTTMKPTTTTTTMKPTTTTTTTKPTSTTMKTTSSTMKTTTSTTTTTTTTSLPPVIFPNTEAASTQVCVCVLASQCDPNGVIGSSGEGVINPRLQYVQCPSDGMVCCRPSSVIRYTINPTVPAPQICLLCGSTLRCSNGVVVPVNSIGLPVPYDQQTCPVPSPCCQGTSSGVYGTGVPLPIGPIQNSGTPQACYCMASWMCTPGNSMTDLGLGVIDPRFSACANPGEVCCRSSTIVVQRSRDLHGSTGSIMNGEASFSRPGCGQRNETYAPAGQPDSQAPGKTYFAEFPWVVALLTVQSDGKYLFQCGGSMITERAVLTAAHCVSDGENGRARLIARFGQWDLESRLEDQPVPFQDADVRAVAIHPEYYAGALFNDVAVLILREPVKLDANVAPVCVPRAGLIFPPGTRCIGTGWGKNSFGGTYQTELRKVELPIVDRAECQTRLRTTKLGPHFRLFGSFICAGGEASRDTCSGDGGGPLVCLTATGQYFQAGIVSWGIGCGMSNIPAVYTDVAQYAQWIEQQLAIYGA